MDWSKCVEGTTQKYRVANFQEALNTVREKYPDAWREGSVGMQRSFWIRGKDGRTHCIGYYIPLHNRLSGDEGWLFFNKLTKLIV